MIRIVASFILMLPGLAACGKSEPPSAQASRQPAAWTAGFPLQQIPQQTLEAGECGLALWTKSQSRTRIFYAVNTRRSGIISFQGRQTSLPAQHEQVDLVRGFSPHQRYADARLTLALNLTIETRQDVLSNAVVRDGILTLTDALSGQSLVLPVVGVIGCA
ncbi:MAG: hypothetical protein AAF607_13805 [Pseudomonadota bacterium]